MPRAKPFRPVVVLLALLAADLSPAGAQLPRPEAALAHVGHYPFEEIDSRAFVELPGLTESVTRLVGSGAASLLTGNVQVPIEEIGGRVVARFCRAHMCGAETMAVLVDPQTGHIGVCHADRLGHRDQPVLLLADTGWRGPVRLSQMGDACWSEIASTIARWAQYGAR